MQKKKKKIAECAFVIDNLTRKNLLLKNIENDTSYKKIYDFQRKHSKTGHISHQIVKQNTIFLSCWTTEISSGQISFGNNFFPSGREGAPQPSHIPSSPEYSKGWNCSRISKNKRSIQTWKANLYHNIVNFRS